MGEEEPKAELEDLPEMDPVEKPSGIMILESLLFGENLLLLVVPPSGVPTASSAFFQKSKGWPKNSLTSSRVEYGIVSF